LEAIPAGIKTYQNSKLEFNIQILLSKSWLKIIIQLGSDALKIIMNKKPQIYPAPAPVHGSDNIIPTS